MSSLVACTTSERSQQASRDKASSIATQQESTAVAAVDQTPSVDSLRDEFVQHGLLVPDSRTEVISRFGAADSVASRAVVNRHNAALTDSIVDLFYPGLHLTYYVVGRGGKEFLQTAVVSDNRYLKYPDFGVGVPDAIIRRSLGEPSERATAKWRYDCGRCMGAESPVYFYLDHGTVQRIEYSFYVD